MDPSVPPPDGVCHFFRLPAELRNLVYDYTLSDPAGVVCREEFHSGSSQFRFYSHAVLDKAGGTDDSELILVSEKSATDSMEVNQLKYVCRQLNSETKIIIISNNELHFDRGASQFTGLLDALPVPLYSHLRNITIRERWNMFLPFLYEEHWQTIADFCKANTACMVRMRLSGFRTCNHMFLLRALDVSMRVRKDTYTQLLTKIFAPSFQQRYVNCIVRRFNVSSIEELPDPQIPNNIRIFPLDVEIDEAQFKKHYEDCWGSYFLTALTGLTPTGIAGWVALTREIMEHGI